MDNKTTLAVVELISQKRKRSERFIGFVPRLLNFDKITYNGISCDILDINVLQKTILRLIKNRCDTVTTLSEALGFYKIDEIERAIVTKQLVQLMKYRMIFTTDRVKYLLTNEGNTYLNSGRVVKNTYTQKFDIFVTRKYAYYIETREHIDEYIDKKGLINKEKVHLSIEKIKKIAEVQAQNVQCSSKGIELQQVNQINTQSVSWPLYICLMQNIKDDSLRTIVVDQKKLEIVDSLSGLFDNDHVAMQEMLSQCIKEQVIEQNLIKTESAEKTEEQINTESAILDSIEKTGDDKSIDISLRNTPGSVFDSSEFELLMHDIFTQHKNDEIWLISPWIKRNAFMKCRLPYMMNFLESGGTVLIGYSKSERIGEEMVDPECMQAIKQLESQFEQFYYCELPPFHNKVVIERSGNKVEYYSGSFNILSFYINDKEEHYRQEQMVVANKESAEKFKKEYLSAFVSNYIERFDAIVDSAEEGSLLDITKIKSLKKFAKLPEIFCDVEEKAANKKLMLISHTSEDVSDEVYNTIAVKIIQQHKDDKDYTKAYLAAFCYLRNSYIEKSDTVKISLLDTDFLKLLKNVSFYQYCTVSIRKAEPNSQLLGDTNMNIIIDDMGYKINGILVPSSTRQFIVSHRNETVHKIPPQNFANGMQSLKYRLFCAARNINALNPA